MSRGEKKGPKSPLSLARIAAEAKSLPYCLPAHYWMTDFEAPLHPYHEIVDGSKSPEGWRLVKRPPLRQLRAMPTPQEETEGIPNDVGLILKRVKRSLVWLTELVNAGSAEAADALTALACLACVDFTELARQHPELFRLAARQRWQLPAMMSLHPLLTDDYLRLFKSLELGADTPLELDPSARWKLDEWAEIAFSLLFYLWNKRRQTLPEFNTDNAPKWWDEAWTLLLETYPAVETEPELFKLVKPPSVRKSRGRVRSYILRKLEERFVAFARP